MTIQIPRALYYQSISEQTGLSIGNDRELIATLREMSAIKADYDSLRSALEDVREKGYGVVMPDSEQMTLEEPQIVRQGGKYSVKLKANAPAIHMIMTNIETEVTPAIGGEGASEDIINFLLQGFDGDVNRIWQSNIFGKSLNNIAEEGLAAKVEALPENVKNKLRETLERILNEGEKAVADVRKFLSAGSSVTPIEALKLAGVDMASPEPLRKAMGVFRDTLKQFEQAVKQLR